MTIGPNGEKRPTNPVAAGVHIARLATGEDEEQYVNPERRASGRKGGKARAEGMTEAERKLIARRAAKARWET